jgi:hypothetical protein
LVFNVLVTASTKELAGYVGSLRGTTQNLAARARAKASPRQVDLRHSSGGCLDRHEHFAAIQNLLSLRICFLRLALALEVPAICCLRHSMLFLISAAVSLIGLNEC